MCLLLQSGASLIRFKPHAPGILALAAIALVLHFALVTIAHAAPSGALDPTFGNGGRVTTSFNQHALIADMALQPDGKIVVAGVSITANSADFGNFALARYNSDGSLDTTFGNGGKVKTPFPQGNAAAVESH